MWQASARMPLSVLGTARLPALRALRVLQFPDVGAANLPARPVANLSPIRSGASATSSPLLANSVARLPFTAAAAVAVR